MSVGGKSVLKEFVELCKNNLAEEVIRNLTKEYQKNKVEYFGDKTISIELSNSLKFQAIESLDLSCDYLKYSFEELKRSIKSVKYLDDLKNLSKELKSLTIEISFVNADGILTFKYINVFDFIEITLDEKLGASLEVKFSNDMMVTF